MSFFGSYPPGGGGGGGGSGTGFTQNGTATLSGGTVTVTNSSVASGSQFFLSYQTVNGIQGVLSVTSVTPGTSFVIDSTSGEDNSVISWAFI